jgi:hypothetical protein
MNWKSSRRTPSSAEQTPSTIRGVIALVSLRWGRSRARRIQRDRKSGPSTKWGVHTNLAARCLGARASSKHQKQKDRRCSTFASAALRQFSNASIAFRRSLYESHRDIWLLLSLSSCCL